MKPLLIVFCKNPILGKVKTRLAKKIGQDATLDVYNRLIKKTFICVEKMKCDVAIFYSDFIPENDIWDNISEFKKKQNGIDLGERMENAFHWGFKSKFSPIVIVGTDLWDLSEKDLIASFKKLNFHDVVLGPSYDGGYYLLGIKKNEPSIFKNMPWSTNQVLSKTLKILKDKRVFLLEEKNDIDDWEDFKNCKGLFENKISAKI